MNDQEFEQLAYANPWSDDPDFLAAQAEDPSRQALVESLRHQDSLLMVDPPEGLRGILLGISREPMAESPASETAEAGNDGAWIRRLMPVAASLLLALTVTLYFLPDRPVQLAADADTTTPAPAESATLQQAVLEHVHKEETMLGDGNDHRYDLQTVNAHLARIGMQLQTNEQTRKLEVTDLKDCVVAKSRSLHLILRGTGGRAVSVLLIGNAPVEDELPIDDSRFHGFVMPTQRGNLVIISERKPDPDVRALQNLFAANMR